MSFSVFPYHIEQLIKLLGESSLASIPEVEEKLHSVYFQNYFDEIGAKTIVAEYDYIDRDYLEDFSSYYVKCFKDYKRKCTRLHFFATEFSRENFIGAFVNNSPEIIASITNSYLGFIVVKPLPKTIIGRTCLKTYPCEQGRCFPTTRQYDVNLFGISLEIRSLAYQEQDSVAAACATSALWSIFHKTGEIFHHPFPTPIEITKAATLNLPADKRYLPNNGLTLEQMAHAIRNVGLEPFPVKTSNEYILKSTVYAYLKAGVPLVLGIILADTSEYPHLRSGAHAVAITGYCMKDKEVASPLKTGFLAKSSRIEKIYVHDDQIGPFARMEIDNVPVSLLVDIDTGRVETYFSLSSSWKGKDGKIGSKRAIPTAILVPLYHKIRIPFEIIDVIVIDFDNFVEVLRANFNLFKTRIEWDIFLSTINDLKKEILDFDGLELNKREEILTAKMPRFIWRARALVEDKPLLELIFDATDIEQGDFFIRPIIYDVGTCEILASLFKLPEFIEITDKFISNSIYKWFRK